MTYPPKRPREWTLWFNSKDETGGINTRGKYIGDPWNEYVDVIEVLPQAAETSDEFPENEAYAKAIDERTTRPAFMKGARWAWQKRGERAQKDFLLLSDQLMKSHKELESLRTQNKMLVEALEKILSVDEAYGKAEMSRNLRGQYGHLLDKVKGNK